LERFAGLIRHIACCWLSSVWKQGIDIPGIPNVVIAGLPRSVADLYQAVGFPPLLL
jgi:hypothetical protein